MRLSETLHVSKKLCQSSVYCKLITEVVCYIFTSHSPVLNKMVFLCRMVLYPGHYLISLEFGNFIFSDVTFLTANIAFNCAKEICKSTGLKGKSFIVKAILWVFSCFFSSLIRWTRMVCEMGGNFAVLWDVASWFCSREHAVFSCNLFLCVLLASNWCIYTIVLTQQQFGSNPVLFYRQDQISTWSIACQ